MSDLPTQHKILAQDEQAEAMMNVLISAVIASRPPMRDLGGGKVFAGVSAKAVGILLSAVLDVVLTAADLSDEDAARIAKIATDQSPENVKQARSILADALAAASTIVFDADDMPTTEASEA